MVKTWGDQRRLSAGGSEIKPLFAHLLFAAVEAGKLAGIDEVVADFEPRLASLNEALSFKDRKITFRHMANQSSCYSAAEDPGTAHDYNDYQMALFGDTLFFKVWGAASFADFTTKVMQPRLTGPLQFEDSRKWDDNGRFPISARDHCRLALLYLRPGADCNDPGTSVTIPAGARVATLTITPSDDGSAEGREVVFLKLTAGASYPVGTPSSAGIVINDNDATLPVVTVSAHDSLAGEAGNPGRFVIAASSSLHGKTVRFVLTGTATNGEDYQRIAESVTFSDLLNPVIQIVVTPIEDAVREGAESVTLTLIPGSGYVAGTQRSATVLIKDNDE